MYGRADGQGRGAFVRDDARPFVYVQHLGAAEHTGVIRLPAALGIKRRAVEHDGEAVLTASHASTRASNSVRKGSA